MLDRVTARERLTAEVHFRNEVARFCDLNRREGRDDPMPEVGLFWMSRDGKLFHKCSVGLREAHDYGAVKMFDVSHHEVWGDAVREHPAWRGKEYDEVPRGRVVLPVEVGRNRFVVMLPKELRRFADRIASAFKLPSTAVDFDYSDIHYRMDRGL